MPSQLQSAIQLNSNSQDISIQAYNPDSSLSNLRHQQAAMAPIHGSPTLTMPRDTDNFFWPETFRLNKMKITTLSAPSETLYALNHDILDMKSARTAPVSFYARSQASVGSTLPTYNLTYGRPDPDSKTECYLAANDKLGKPIGNVELKAFVKLDASGNKKLHAQLSRGRFWYHKDKFVKNPLGLLSLKKRGHRYEYYLDAASAGGQSDPLVAREHVSETGERELKLLAGLCQEQKDILVAVWCLRLWRETGRAREKARAKRLERLERTKRLIEERTQRAEGVMEELILRLQEEQQALTQQHCLPMLLADEQYAHVHLT